VCSVLFQIWKIFDKPLDYREGFGNSSAFLDKYADKDIGAQLDKAVHDRIEDQREWADQNERSGICEWNCYKIEIYYRIELCI
jgi:hypothetical protein